MFFSNGWDKSIELGSSDASLENQTWLVDVGINFKPANGTVKSLKMWRKQDMKKIWFWYDPLRWFLAKRSFSMGAWPADLELRGKDVSRIRLEWLILVSTVFCLWCTESQVGQKKFDSGNWWNSHLNRHKEVKKKRKRCQSPNSLEKTSIDEVVYRLYRITEQVKSEVLMSEELEDRFGLHWLLSLTCLIIL